MNLPTSWTRGSALGFLKSDLFLENPKIVTNFKALIAGPIWPSKSPNLDIVVKCIFVAHHVRFQTQFESTQSDNWFKSYEKIPRSAQVGIKLQIWLWIIPGVFTFGQLLVNLEVLFWLNSRFLDFYQFINN